MTSALALRNQHVVVAFVDSAGRRSNEIALAPNAMQTTFVVPATATNVVLSSPECDAEATTFDLPASGASRLDVELARNPWAGFLAALGFRDVRPTFVVAKPEQPK